MKKHLTPLINRETGIETSIRYHFTPDRMGVLKKTRDNKSWWGCREEKTLVHCKLVQPLWKKVCISLKKLKNRTAMRSSNSISGCLSKETEITWKKNISTSLFTAALFTMTKIHSNLSAQHRMDKERVVHCCTPDTSVVWQSYHTLGFVTFFNCILKPLIWV